MRVAIVGGGPAGLYLAILLRRGDPAAEIEVFERNGPDDTFGFGVVFSGKTLAHLREADAPSHDAIAAAFQSWDNVDIVHRGEKVSVHGNRFSAIERLALLRILQRRAAEVGVRIEYRTEVRDVASLLERADVVVGADGVNSTVRRTFEAELEPSLETRAAPYIWYGTPRPFHGLTLTFRETKDGVFAAHSYKYAPGMSTFIVECDERTWRTAGLDAMPEPEARRHLEGVFAEDLAGAPLVSNASRWIRFVVVKNGRWSHRNVVLLGDALHTAHFSIGSGTKLALEDAIALAAALRSEDASGPGVGADRIARALDVFERKRRPDIEAYQEVAHESMVWFERVRDLMPLDPLRLAYRAMLRAGRIDHENLRRRDPEFIARYERDFPGT